MMIPLMSPDDDDDDDDDDTHKYNGEVCVTFYPHLQK